jgi:hypothetical protein
MMAITDKQFDFLSQLNHILFGMVVIWGKIALHGPGHIWWVAGGIVMYAALKEFWYDHVYEDPETRGSDLRDFLYYVLGTAVALGGYYLLHWIQT